MDREEYERLRQQFSSKKAEDLKKIVSSEEFTEEAKEAAKDVLAEGGVYVRIENSSTEESVGKKSGSTIGEIIKIVAWIQLISSLFIALAFYARRGLRSFLIAAVSSCLAFLVPYALGEICCLLAEIRDNTNKQK